MSHHCKEPLLSLINAIHFLQTSPFHANIISSDAQSMRMPKVVLAKGSLNGHFYFTCSHQFRPTPRE